MDADRPKNLGGRVMAVTVLRSLRSRRTGPRTVPSSPFSAALTRAVEQRPGADLRYGAVNRAFTSAAQLAAPLKDHKVTDKKEIRKIIGYTHQKQRYNADLWYKNSLSFYEASIVLHENIKNISGGVRIFQYNAALLTFPPKTEPLQS